MWKQMANQFGVAFFLSISILLLSSFRLTGEAFLVKHTFTSYPIACTRSSHWLTSIGLDLTPSTALRNLASMKFTSKQRPIVSGHLNFGNARVFMSSACIAEHSRLSTELQSKVPISLLDKAKGIEYTLLQSTNQTEDGCVAAIEAWRRAGQPDKAEAIFQHFRDIENTTMSRLTYSALLVTHVQAQKYSHAKEILAMMENSSMLSQQPNVRDYNILLSGYAQNGRQYFGEAQQLLERMEQQNNENMKPDISSYSSMIDLYTTSDCDNADKWIDEAVDRITSLAHGKRFFSLNFMRPYQIPLNKALKYWKLSNRSDAAERAERIMKRMEDVGLADTLTYTQFMTILINKDKRCPASKVAERVQNIGNNMLQSHLDGKKFVKPSTQTWNTIINAWVQCGKLDRAEEVLKRMEHEFYNDNDMAPNLISYSTVIDGWVKSDQMDALDHVEGLYERLKQLSMNTTNSQRDIRPNQRTHAAFIRAYSKHNTAAAVEKAEELLYEMYQKYESGFTDMKPNMIILTTIIEAWGANGTKHGAEKAEALLDFAIAANKDKNDPTLCPNEVSFSSAISAWSRVRCLGKAVHAQRILCKMMALQEQRRLDTTPNAFCYTAVINACAYCMNDESEKRNALRIAINTYKELDRAGIPNHVTYINMLVALQNLLPPSPQRSAAAKDLFQSAMRNGYVSLAAINRIKSILTNSELKALNPLLLGDFRVDTLPKDWCRSMNIGSSVKLAGNK